MNQNNKEYKPLTTADLSDTERRVLRAVAMKKLLQRKDIVKAVDANMIRSNYVSNCLTRLKRWGLVSNQWKIKPIETVSALYCLRCHKIVKEHAALQRRNCGCNTTVREHPPNYWAKVKIDICIDYTSDENAEIPISLNHEEFSNREAPLDDK